MTSKKKTKPAARQQRSPQFKAEALKLADSVGVAEAARQLGIYESQLYQWRTKAKNAKSLSERENELAVENARLKRELAEQKEELAILKKATVYFAKNQR